MNLSLLEQLGHPCTWDWVLDRLSTRPVDRNNFITNLGRWSVPGDQRNRFKDIPAVPSRILMDHPLPCPIRHEASNIESWQEFFQTWLPETEDAKAPEAWAELGLDHFCDAASKVLDPIAAENLPFDMEGLSLGSPPIIHLALEPIVSSEDPGLLQDIIGFMLFLLDGLPDLSDYGPVWAREWGLEKTEFFGPLTDFKTNVSQARERLQELELTIDWNLILPFYYLEDENFPTLETTMTRQGLEEFMTFTAITRPLDRQFNAILEAPGPVWPLGEDAGTLLDTRNGTTMNPESDLVDDSIWWSLLLAYWFPDQKQTPYRWLPS